MPRALDRLVASPSALRLLRSIVDAPELPVIWIPALSCCPTTASQRRWEATYTKARPNRLFKGQKRIHGLNLASDHSRSLDIEYESAVNHPVGATPRRVDNPDEPNKILLWTELLQYQYRVHGLEGIRYIWRGMVKRDIGIPTSTPEARILWGTLIKHRGIVEQVLAHAIHTYKTTGRFYPTLYEDCIGYWLSRRPTLALKCHEVLVSKLPLKRLPLQNLAALATKDANSLKTFSKIYQSSVERNVYDHIVLALCDKGEVLQARRWHLMCFERNDRPSSEARSHPMVRKFIAEYNAFAHPVTVQHSAKDGETDIKHTTYTNSEGVPRVPKYNQELMRRLMNREIGNVRYDDSFCARLFATRAFPVSSIIKGLRLVGVSEIGSQALRELALRAEPVSELPWLLKQLEDVGVSVRSSVFSLALEKFTKEKNFRLVRSLLASDQHPDVLEDAETQAKLLSYYLEQGDWEQAHRTLAILTLFHNDVKTESWNLMLQARIKQVDPGRITQILQEMHQNQVTITKETVLAIRNMLRRRQPGRRPVTHRGGHFDDLRFVSRTLMTILESGMGYVSPWLWREILRRFGMFGRLRELRRLVHWLLQWYAIRDGTSFSKLPKSEFLDAATARLRKEHKSPKLYFNIPHWLSQKNRIHPLRQLFSPAWQQGLVIWGFRAGLLSNTPLEQSLFTGVATNPRYRSRLLRKGLLNRISWTYGLRLLVELRDAGVLVQPYTVIQACKMMFMVMFGAGRSHKRANRIVEDVNRVPYHVYVREINRIWGRALFKEPESIVQRRLGTYADWVNPRTVMPAAALMDEAELRVLRELEVEHMKRKMEAKAEMESIEEQAAAKNTEHPSSNIPLNGALAALERVSRAHHSGRRGRTG
ncbi:hypothetical protein GQ43DRAFT_440841 [Delitschia confertaspora ATCC 74209]|uniref:Pentatricopeptide repeat domain protein n=1 Tax=Delitschia confertaspora ATCC 74209 TaxID=1513339 RepID=A0A9P4MS61_9PLEO|nr:hypothetical protein GQ43DRAFT_440841 [Delitschia confertaspora ATCC 74209]